jgi:hypothetical protein
MTLNHRKDVSVVQTESLRTLLAAVTGLPLNFPDDEDWPVNARFEDLVYKSSAKVPLVYPACGFYFDIAPGKDLPNVKVQVPLYVYGREEQQMADGVAQWMKDNGRGKFADLFLEALPRLGDRGTAHGPDRVKVRSVKGANGVHANGTNGTNGMHTGMPRGLQSYLSIMFTADGQLEVTTYLTPVLSETPWLA